MSSSSKRRPCTGTPCPLPSSLEAQRERAYYAYLLRGEGLPRLLTEDPMSHLGACLDAYEGLIRCMPNASTFVKYEPLPEEREVYSALKNKGKYETTCKRKSYKIWIECETK